MKSMFFALVISIVFITGCSKDDKENPVSYIDGYKVDFTEPKGTSHSGDYFPIKEDYTCNYSGSAKIISRLTFSGYGSEADTTEGPAYGMLKVLAQCNIPLPSGTLLLYPIVDITEMPSGGEVVADTSRFFYKDAEAVYVKALKLDDGSYLEVQNPIFIKSNLVVGDTWETAPKMDMTKLLASEMDEDISAPSNMSLSTRAKFFVVGNETIALPFGTRTGMRLEQANDVSMTGSVMSEGVPVSIIMTARLANVYHVIADTGIVHQSTTGPLNMTFSAQGLTGSLTMTIKKSELFLTDLGDTPGYVDISGLSKLSFTGALPATLNTPTKITLWKTSQALVKILTKNLSL